MSAERYNELGQRIRHLGEREPLSNRFSDFPASTLAFILISGLLSIGVGMLGKIDEQEKEKLRVLILEKLSNKITQKEGMQMINNFLSNVDKKVVEELLTATKGEQLSDLTIKTLLNITNEKQIAEKGEAKIKEHIQNKKEIIFYFLNALDIENEKNTNKNNRKEEYRNNKYKDKLRDAIKTICNPTSENAKISMNNLFIIMDLSKNCSDNELREWAQGRLELLKEKTTQ